MNHKRNHARTCIAVVFLLFLGLFVASAACDPSNLTCEPTDHKCAHRGNWQACTVKDSDGFCVSRYVIATDGKRIDCYGCECNQAYAQEAFYCAGLDGDPGLAIPPPSHDGGDAGDAGDGGDATADADARDATTD